MLTFHHVGDWGEGRVRVEWTDRSSRQVVPEVEDLIERAWADAGARPGVCLFDGPMCRLESSRATADALVLVLSPTSYKPFLGTNLTHPGLADRYGPSVLANPLGVSAIVETADGYLVLGERNASVAYYPNRLHPFAGALEPADATEVFGAVRRELSEEVSLAPEEVSDVRCVGMVEDRALRQPELIFIVRSTSASNIGNRVDRREHKGSVALPAVESEVRKAVRNSPLMTPVGVASLLLWGRGKWGEAWFREEADRAVAPHSFTR